MLFFLFLGTISHSRLTLKLKFLCIPFSTVRGADAFLLVVSAVEF